MRFPDSYLDWDNPDNEDHDHDLDDEYYPEDDGEEYL